MDTLGFIKDRVGLFKSFSADRLKQLVDGSRVKPMKCFHRTIYRVVVLLLVLGPLANGFAAEPSGAAQKPNIVHIVADDLGWKDVGFNGATDLKTPNLDKLAATGAKFSQFYVQPMCTPTRAALMTGRYPFRYGLQTIVIPTAAGYGLDTTEWLMPQC